MKSLHRATSGFHPHGSGTEQRPDKPTHAALVGSRYATCGASVEQLFVRCWGPDGPDTGGCIACQGDNVRRLAAPHDDPLGGLRLVR
jgi:hypothetical protein